jgi:hypothetical protein
VTGPRGYDDAHTQQSLNPWLHSSTSRSRVDALGVDRRAEEVATESGPLKLAKNRWIVEDILELIS